jgi:hypothetical protein
MIHRSIEYRIGARRTTAHVVSRLGGLSIYELTQQVNNANIAQANAESSGDYAAAAAANAQAATLQAQLNAVYAGVTPPSLQAQTNYVLAASAPTPVTIAPPPPAPIAAPPPAAPATSPAPVVVSNVSYAPAPAATSYYPPANAPTAVAAHHTGWDGAIQDALPEALQGYAFGSVPKWFAAAGATAAALYWFTK